MSYLRHCGLFACCAALLLMATSALADDTSINKAPAAKINRRKPTRFIRVRYDEFKSPVALQTASAKYVLTNADGKNELEVVLEGVIHVGDRSYYREFNRRFRHYDAVLYELVAPAEKLIPDPNDKRQHPLRLLQRVSAEGLGFASQIDEIDYKAANMVHSDLSPTELASVSKGRGDDQITMLLEMFTDILRKKNLEGDEDPDSEDDATSPGESDSSDEEPAVTNEPADDNNSDDNNSDDNNSDDSNSDDSNSDDSNSDDSNSDDSNSDDSNSDDSNLDDSNSDDSNSDDSNSDDSNSDDSNSDDSNSDDSNSDDSNSDDNNSDDSDSDDSDDTDSNDDSADDVPPLTRTLRILSDPDGAVKIRRLLAKGFDQSPSLEAMLRPSQQATLIEARNERALTVFQEQLDAGKRRIALFWGAGHMADFERQLVLTYGLQPAGIVWRDAWDLRDGAVEFSPLESILEKSIRGSLKDAVKGFLRNAGERDEP